MFSKISQVLAVLSFTTMLVFSANNANDNIDIVTEPVITTKTVTVDYDNQYTSEPTNVIEVKTLVKADEVIEYNLTEEEIELIALVTMAEAEGESEEGKRLVIDTILNRIDSDLRYFPDTAYDVVYQKNAFSSMWNGRVDRVEATDEVIELVKEELISRTNSEVLYFHAKHYGKYGTPLFSVGNHYFSGV